MKQDSIFPLRVVERRREADDVVSLYLADPNGAMLPRWTAGAHIDLILPSGKVRQYSLNGDLDDLSTYRIGVLLAPDSRGGSQEVHEMPIGGAELNVRGPRNQFPLREAEGYVFLAGGIGITPILPMLAEAEARRKPWRLIYGGRSRASMAYVEEILAFENGSVEFFAQDERGFPNLDEIVKGVSSSELVYACGPTAMLEAIELMAGKYLTQGQLQIERFNAGDQSELVFEENRSFECELRKAGVVFTVPPDRSLLEMVLEIDPDYMWACEEGYCGTCITDVLEGQPEHRDTCLTEEERESNTLMTICVSRALSDRIVLDV